MPPDARRGFIGKPGGVARESVFVYRLIASIGSTGLSNNVVRFKRKHVFLAMNRACLALVFLLLLAAPLSARENEYDVLSKMLTPFESLFARESGAARPAAAADLVLAEVTGTSAPPMAPGSLFHAALQTPDKVFISGPVFGRQIAACRDGSELWAFPGAQIAAILGSAGAPPPPSKLVLGDIVLPIPQKQLVFLPILFQVRDAGDEVLDNETCRVLDVTLMPQLAASLKAQDWAARVWIRADYTPAKIDLSKPGWHIALLFNKIDFVPALPPSTWQPAPEQKSDVVHLTAAQLIQLAALAGLKIQD